MAYANDLRSTAGLRVILCDDPAFRVLRRFLQAAGRGSALGWHWGDKTNTTRRERHRRTGQPASDHTGGAARARGARARHG